MWNWGYYLDFVRRIEFLRIRPALHNGTNGVRTLFLLACDDGSRASFRTVMVLRIIQDDRQKSKLRFILLFSSCLPVLYSVLQPATLL